MEPTETVTTEVTADATALMEALARIPRRPPVPAHPDTERRDQYAAALREHIKGLTFPAATPGGAPMFGATEYDLADVALMLADAETAQLRAERDAALRIAGVWGDAPDPFARAMADDLRSAIRGARPARLLDCGWCYEEDGEEVHPHPECPRGVMPPASERCGETSTGMLGRLLGPCTNPPHTPDTFHRDTRGDEWRDHGTPALCGKTGPGSFGTLGPCINTPHTPNGPHRDARGAKWQKLDNGHDDLEQRHAALLVEHAQLEARATRLLRTLAAVCRFNELTADSCRVHAAEHARDTLTILDANLDVPLTTKASNAREDLLNLMAQWGLTTGRGSREHATRILDRRAHEAAEQLRDWARGGDANADEYGTADNVLEGADRIDPVSPRYAGGQH
jgi:hypothetical protein